MDQLISFVNKTSFAVTGVTFSSQFQREAAEFNKSTKKNSNIFSHFHSLNSLQSASLKLLTTVILLPNYREITVSIFSNLLPSPMRYRHSSTDCKVNLSPYMSGWTIPCRILTEFVRTGGFITRDSSFPLLSTISLWSRRQNSSLNSNQMYDSFYWRNYSCGLWIWVFRMHTLPISWWSILCFQPLW